jgi:hypothetical protein
MLIIRENAQDSAQALLNRLDEVHHTIRELARIILPGQGDFVSVWEITNRVFDEYYRPHANAA